MQGALSLFDENVKVLASVTIRRVPAQTGGAKTNPVFGSVFGEIQFGKEAARLCSCVAIEERKESRVF